MLAPKETNIIQFIYRGKILTAYIFPKGGSLFLKNCNAECIWRILEGEKTCLGLSSHSVENIISVQRWIKTQTNPEDSPI